MANTDYTVTLAIEGKEYSATLKKANREMQEMKRHAKGAGSSFGDMTKKFAGFAAILGGASAAMAAFNKLVTDNQTAADEWARKMQAAQAAYSGFANALSTGDFSTYFSNMKQLVSLAREAADALDRLQTVNIFSDLEIAGIDKDITKYRAWARSGDSAKKKEAATMLPQLLASRQTMVGTKATAAEDAASKMMRQFLGEKGYYGNANYERYYKTLSGYDEAEQLAKLLKRKAQLETTAMSGASGGYSESGVYMTAAVSNEELRKRQIELDAINERLKDASPELRAFAAALAEISDEKLAQYADKLKEAYGYWTMQYAQEGSAYRAIRTAGKGEGSKTGDQMKIRADANSIFEKFDFDVDKMAEDLMYQLAPIINRMQEAMAAQIAQRGMETSYINQIANPETTKQVYNYSDALGAVSQAISGVSSATSGMNSGLSMALGIIQSILSVVGGILSIVGGASPLGMFGLMGGLIGGKFAKGGVVGGTSYAGDHLVASVSSGEMVLTRAQQSNLLALANGQARGGASEAYVRGDTIYMSLSNYMSRTGKKLQ